MKNRFAIALAGFTVFFMLISVVHAANSESANSYMIIDEGGILQNSPWVYPASISDPTTTSYYTVLLAAGTNKIDLVFWNHDPVYNFALGKFVIAIKDGNGAFTIDSMNLAFDTENLTGQSTPDHMPRGGIFPCPWKQYDVGKTLTKRMFNNGWHGTGDPSGVFVNITITVNTNPASIKLYFVAWGFNVQNDGGLQEVKSPYSHITETITPPQNNVPETPLGTIMAGISIVAAFGAYFSLRKRKL